MGLFGQWYVIYERYHFCQLTVVGITSPRTAEQR